MDAHNTHKEFPSRSHGIQFHPTDYKSTPSASHLLHPDRSLLFVCQPIYVSRITLFVCGADNNYLTQKFPSLSLYFSQLNMEQSESFCIFSCLGCFSVSEMALLIQGIDHCFFTGRIQECKTLSRVSFIKYRNNRN